jgi:hypothetical protein
MFADHPISYLSDNFTPASFVSHAASVKRLALKKVDLLPRIQHKVLVTPELAPIFRGKEDDLTQRFAIITRVLDGQGLQTDSGTHGQRGYRGDYLFAWIGCTTPLEEKVWKVMAQLGSRLFFLLMDTEQPVTVEDLLASTQGPPYKERLTKCKGAIHALLTDLFQVEKGQPRLIRAVEWNSSEDPQAMREWIARFAMVLAAMRSLPRTPNPFEIAEGKHEQPYRAQTILYNLARGHALVHGRRRLSEEDLPPIAKVTVSSMPTKAARAFTALVRKGEPLTVVEVQAALGAKSPETARGVMEELRGTGVMDHVEAGPGKAATLCFKSPEWDWCASSEFQALLLGG